MNGQSYDIPLGVSEDNINFSAQVPNVNLTVEENFMTAGTTDYNALNNKPQINSVELKGNKSFADLGMAAMSNIEILSILK